MRELSDDDVRLQAEALHGYVVRGGELGLWFASKALSREDESAVRREYAKRAAAGLPPAA